MEHEAPAEPEAVPAEDVEYVEYVEEELLIEEISIDGMCGVY
jgi:mycofactocin precursor